ncbi:hypothetical protein FNH22_19490 [Fulvivirga sp. M361]|uniref:IPT/TIG domain-containing protein n=1 Tax=Fulvivirga sp. M361 TaxID=2594266 RepID=UPI00117A339B|nr:IPT/TIG domain-containing protein [Fulvivirga sp. M361]TRX54302.1 hypothetical protein FNH22_19490 [Fulvivirga sp. M361]
MKKIVEITKRLFLPDIGIIVFFAAMITSCNDQEYTFEADPIEPVTITGIEPVGSDIGTTVTISGTNFSRTLSNNKVNFNGAIAEVTEATDTTLTVTVPDDATTGSISVFHGGFTATGPVFTIIPAPTITSFDPTGGKVGITVTISGTNFSPTAGDNTVSFNGVDAMVINATTTSLTVTVPEGAQTGEISMTVFGQTAISEASFVLTPEITSFEPTTGEVGTLVTITGKNFSTILEDNVVKFNGVEAIVTIATNTSLVVEVPEVADTGPITVEIEDEIATSSDFTLAGPITLIIPITVDIDDVEESEADGRMWLDSNDQELGEFDTSSTPDRGLQNIGLRFRNVEIPKDATILSASVQFTADNIGADPVELTIFGENVGNSAEYTVNTSDLSNRALTTANAVWSIPEWVTIGDKLDAQKTVDLAAIIQEIVGHVDWASGNSLNIIMKHSGVSVGVTSSTGGREAETFEGDAVSELIVTFE